MKVEERFDLILCCLWIKYSKDLNLELDGEWEMKKYREKKLGTTTSNFQDSST